MTSDQQDSRTPRCPYCGGRPTVAFSTGMAVCEPCDLRWDRETGETLSEMIEEEAELLGGQESHINKRFSPLASWVIRICFLNAITIVGLEAYYAHGWYYTVLAILVMGAVAAALDVLLLSPHRAPWNAFKREQNAR